MYIYGKGEGRLRGKKDEKRRWQMHIVSQCLLQPWKNGTDVSI